MTSHLDLGRFVQRRQFRSFEQDLACVTYAYGVDVRRFHWLNQSMTAQTFMRALELRWSSVADELMREELQVPEGAATLPPLLCDCATLQPRCRNTQRDRNQLEKGAACRNS